MSSTDVMDEVTLTLTRHFDAPRQRVYEAWSQAEFIAQWFGPDDMSVPECTFEATPGAAYRIVMQGGDGNQHVVHGVVREVSPPDRLAYSWAWEGQDWDSEVTLEFADDGDGTMLTLTHAKLPSQGAADSHKGGWTSSFVSLDRLLAA